MFFNLCVKEGKSRSGIEEKIFRMRGSGSKYGDNYTSGTRRSLNTLLFKIFPSCELSNEPLECTNSRTVCICVAMIQVMQLIQDNQVRLAHL